MHLRRCAQCGHVGCCDSSPAQHATAHARAAGHPVVQSFEPGEDWFWDYERGEALHRPDARRADPPPARPARARPGRPRSPPTGAATSTDRPPRHRAAHGRGSSGDGPVRARRARGGAARGRRRHHPAPAVRPAVRRHRRTDLAQARRPAGRPLLQAARRLQPARPASAPTSAPPGRVCASAGNHGQGMAYACRRLGMRGRVYVPAHDAAPEARADPRAGRRRGGARRRRRHLRRRRRGGRASTPRRTGATVVPAFDDLRTIAGQGTVGVEIVAQLGRAPDVVVVPVGGGGLVAGRRELAGRGAPGRAGGRRRAGGRGEHGGRPGRGRRRWRCRSSTRSSTAPPCAGWAT